MEIQAPVTAHIGLLQTVCNLMQMEISTHPLDIVNYLGSIRDTGLVSRKFPAGLILIYRYLTCRFADTIRRWDEISFQSNEHKVILEISRFLSYKISFNCKSCFAE